MGFERDDQRLAKQSTTAQHTQHESSRDQAQRMAAECRGDVAKLAELLAKLATQPAIRDAVLTAAHRMYGNAFVQAAIDKKSIHVHQNMDIRQGRNAPLRGGLDELGNSRKDMFADDKDDKKAATPKMLAGALSAKYGDTFGAGRLGGGEGPLGTGPIWGKGPGHMNPKGHASDKETDTDTGGAPAPVAYPGNGTPGSEGGQTTTVPMSSGDNAGVSSGTASGTVMAPAPGSGFTNLGNFTGTSATTGLAAAVSRAEGSKTSVKRFVLAPIPREDVDQPGGGPVVINQADARTQASKIQRNIDARTNKAGGPGDGRGGTDATDTQDASGGTTTTRREMVDGQVEASSGGEINWDAVLKINQVINPGSGS